ncbi:olfactory receptor 1468-like [Rhinoderma darwinii]|uniref:olfactory receptor 1468-like n=1 Tax=Rhinoderma darwinii TaxID=43563 RepID=UPI003F675E00
MEHENYMKNSNCSLASVILLSGLKGFKTLSTFIFLLLLIIYCVTICGNLLIILVVSNSRSLHSPMYFFLTQLSLSDILLSTTIVPNMLRVVLYEGSSVSFIGCLTQFYCFSASELLQSLLLTVMSYDRYQAICNPLHYTSVMDLTFCIRAVVLFWVIISVLILINSVTMSRLQFCGPNIIDHYFCDRDPILELSCSDTFIIKVEGLFLIVPLAICPFIVIIVSYVYIVITILKIPSVTRRQKTFSTCSSHLAVVSIYYGSVTCIYLFPNQKIVNKILSVFYTVITPLLNPIIYSLSNRDINKALTSLMSKTFNIFQAGRHLNLWV